MTNRKFNIIMSIALAAALSLLAAVTAKITERERQRAVDFKQTCKQLGGRPVHDTTRWQCLSERV